MLAQNGLLPVWGAVVSAAAGACVADQLWFWLARHYGREKWIERVENRPAFQRALRILEHHLILFTLGFRFVYGMRTVTPIAISASRIRSRTFVMLNSVSAAVWGLTMVWLGFLFGKAINPWLQEVKSATLLMLGAGAAILLAALAPRLVRRWRRRRLR